MSGSVSYGLMHNQIWEADQKEAKDAQKQRRNANRQRRSAEKDEKRQRKNRRRGLTTTEELREELGNNSTVSNKLGLLHNTGTRNQYYKNKKKRWNRGERQGVVRNLYGHLERKNYRGRDGRHQLLVNTINQAEGEINRNSYRRGKNIHHLVGVNNPTNKMISNAGRVTNRRGYSGMGQSHQSIGGSKKRKQQVKGRRVLKNGAVAGYVKQRDGTWKWRFLPR